MVYIMIPQSPPVSDVSELRNVEDLQNQSRTTRKHIRRNTASRTPPVDAAMTPNWMKKTKNHILPTAVSIIERQWFEAEKKVDQQPYQS
jgi:hypothetical protein